MRKPTKIKLGYSDDSPRPDPQLPVLQLNGSGAQTQRFTSLMEALYSLWKEFGSSPEDVHELAGIQARGAWKNALQVLLAERQRMLMDHDATTCNDGTNGACVACCKFWEMEGACFPHVCRCCGRVIRHGTPHPGGGLICFDCSFPESGSTT